jgi:hypothetical protein
MIKNATLPFTLNKEKRNKPCIAKYKFSPAISKRQLSTAKLAVHTKPSNHYHRQVPSKYTPRTRALCFTDGPKLIYILFRSALSYNLESSNNGGSSKTVTHSPQFGLSSQPLAETAMWRAKASDFHLDRYSYVDTDYGLAP